MRATAALLADAARVENGKLYVHGGAWDTIAVDAFPATHPTMALVLVYRVEYSEALTDWPIVVELLDEDDRPVGPRLDGTINAGHPPGTIRGSPVFIPQSITMNLLPFEKGGGYRFRVSSGDSELASVPFRVTSQR
ncbi:MAG: hypothetical protein E6G44_00360 [Actinobacteria bacterium]|nr:MAG: hypothetical protein E6G44_00360 [Actinomycetota bacterium]